MRLGAARLMLGATSASAATASRSVRQQLHGAACAHGGGPLLKGAALIVCCGFIGWFLSTGYALDANRGGQGKQLVICRIASKCGTVLPIKRWLALGMFDMQARVCRSYGNASWCGPGAATCWRVSKGDPARQAPRQCLPGALKATSSSTHRRSGDSLMPIINREGSNHDHNQEEGLIAEHTHH